MDAMNRNTHAKLEKMNKKKVSLPTKIQNQQNSKRGVHLILLKFFKEYFVHLTTACSHIYPRQTKLKLKKFIKFIRDSIWNRCKGENCALFKTGNLKKVFSKLKFTGKTKIKKNQFESLITNNADILFKFFSQMKYNEKKNQNLKIKNPKRIKKEKRIKRKKKKGKKIKRNQKQKKNQNRKKIKRQRLQNQGKKLMTKRKQIRQKRMERKQKPMKKMERKQMSRKILIIWLCLRIQIPLT